MLHTSDDWPCEDRYSDTQDLRTTTQLRQALHAIHDSMCHAGNHTGMPLLLLQASLCPLL